MCFQILGVDIFIDRRAKPWLIEVNQSPSFATDSQLDKRVKMGVLKDAIKILCLSEKRKQKYLQVEKIEMQQRLQGSLRRHTYEEKECLRRESLIFKDRNEMSRRGGYERIYPL